TEVNQFDYNTISDVILHVKYTAKEGGSGLKEAANKTLKKQVQEIKQGLGQKGLYTALNMKQELPNDWHVLKRNGNIELTLDKSKLPYMIKSIETTEIESVIFIAKVNPADFTINIDDTETKLLRVDEDELKKLYWGINLNINIDASFN